eukprot:gene3166-biopygen11206
MIPDPLPSPPRQLHPPPPALTTRSLSPDLTNDGHEFLSSPLLTPVVRVPDLRTCESLVNSDRTRVAHSSQPFFGPQPDQHPEQYFCRYSRPSTCYSFLAHTTVPRHGATARGPPPPCHSVAPLVVTKEDTVCPPLPPLSPVYAEVNALLRPAMQQPAVEP